MFLKIKKKKNKVTDTIIWIVLKKSRNQRLYTSQYGLHVSKMPPAGGNVCVTL